MSILSILLFYFLIIYSTSQGFNYNINKEEFKRCFDAGDKGVATIEKCTAITSTFKNEGENESQCCMVTYMIDPLEKYKFMFGENWKEEYMKHYGLDENQFEDELNRIYSSVSEVNMCFDLIKKYKNVELYSISLSSYEGKIKYNCGDGEETFEKNNFYPSNEEEKMNKDYIECGIEHEEKNCFKKSSKLLSDNTQCCWCEENTIYDNSSVISSSSEGCVGYPIQDFRNKLEVVLKENKEKKYTMKCNCVNKTGKSVHASLNSINGQIEIE